MDGIVDMVMIRVKEKSYCSSRTWPLGLGLELGDAGMQSPKEVRPCLIHPKLERRLVRRGLVC